jgi:multidrug efflux pump subunit AcrB
MFSKFFIERPIFATVISLVIVIAGLVAMKALPVAMYPTITPVQVQVTTTYPGADSKTVGDSVAAPIEAQINGVDNMLYMTSTSSNTGQMTITVFFTLNTDPDIAQVQVQNRVSLAMPQLPEAVAQYGVSVQKKSSTPLMIISVYNKDGRYTPDYVTNYTNVYILDAIKRVNGAGQAQIFGVPDQAMRIWMNPDRMAAMSITTTDIQNAVAKQNALVGAGQVGQQPNDKSVHLTFPVTTQAPFVKPSEYDDIILRANSDGSAIVRVKDVARADVGRRQYIDDNRLNGAPATPIIVYQQPGANGLEVSKQVRKVMKDLKSTMPDGIEYVIALDTTDFVRISIDEVIHTLFEAIILVILVVYFFLQSFRLGFHPCGVPPGHDRAAIQAIRHHHRHLGSHFRVRGADPEPGDVRAPAEAFHAFEPRHLWPDQPVLCLVQQGVPSLYLGLRGRCGAHDQADDDRFHTPCLSSLGAPAPLPHDPNGLRAQRGPGIRDGPAHYARRRKPQPDGRDLKSYRRVVREESGGGEPDGNQRL